MLAVLQSDATPLSHVAEHQASLLAKIAVMLKSYLSLFEAPLCCCTERDWHKMGSLTSKKKVQVACPKLVGCVAGWFIWVSPV